MTTQRVVSPLEPMDMLGNVNETRSLEQLWKLVPGPELEPESYQIGAFPNIESAFSLASLAALSVGASTVAASQLAQERGISENRGPNLIDVHHALAAWSGHIKVDGEPIPKWADLSGRYATADGRFVQLHCNFPHHAQGVADRLGVELDRSEFEAALKQRNALEIEGELIGDGMICAVYRSMDEWDAHPQADATKALPLIDIDQLGSGQPVQLGAIRDRPLDGVRVVDCTRVLAGPTCGQTLAAHGADVLRVGAAHLPSIESGVLSTGFGKRNAFVDLSTNEGASAFEALLADAHVFIDAYRPGALASRGFSAADVASIRPGIIVIELCAFDWFGPWAGRRGFDSIMQTTTGLAIAEAERVGAPEPVHLPVQALDYASGYLAAFAALRLLHQQQQSGGSWRARLSLLRTRNWLTSLSQTLHPGDSSSSTSNASPDIDDYLIQTDSPFGLVESVGPVAGRWDLPPSPLGSAEAKWSAPV